MNEKEIYKNEIKEKFKNDSLQELRQTKFYNMMDDHWSEENYWLDEALKELIEEKEKIEVK